MDVQDLDQKRMTQAVPLLLDWFSHNARILPWRADQEPYHVWLSEIMLQQTRVEAVKGYYARFLAALPTIADLAQAPEEQILKLWEGLGYYNRVRNLQKAAQEIMTRFEGVFPRQYEDILSLPGIGAYTAGAISSICFGEPRPAVDGNVLRVIARLLCFSDSVDQPASKRLMTELLAAEYPVGHCGAFTQSLMELGALVCIPNGAPHCEVCPVAACCLARERDCAAALPVRDAKRARRKEQHTVFLLLCGDAVAVCRRPAKGLLRGLWEFPNVQGLLTPEAAIRQAEAWGVRPAELLQSVSRTHVFTHVEWEMTGYYLRCAARDPQFLWADTEKLTGEIALPTAFRLFWPELQGYL